MNIKPMQAALALCAGAVLALPAAAQVVKVDGSSTVFPVTEAVAEDFQKQKRGRISRNRSAAR
jgi:phosphate transport system substrate-binding protein